MRWRIMGGALVGLVLAATAVESWRVLTPTPALRASARLVEIPPHARLRDIARRLQTEGVIRSPGGFIGLSLLQGQARRLKAGEYEFPQGVATPAVLRQMAAGGVRQHLVLHPEGATVAELGRALGADRLATPPEIERAASDPVFLNALGIEVASLEGYLFPDTYQFVRGMTAEEILARMVQRLFAKLTPEIRERARVKGISLHELLTFASIVEREAAVKDERPLIAAVFWNRLRREMPLQADPTVQYAVRKERGTLTRTDLETDHPYNTYRRPGFPPGPIASPGMASIEAVLEPAPVSFLYFVAVDDQRHEFSTTLEQHNAAVARYRQTRARGG
jgi:peptidoglycan lytic transglycosylase G